ncbi:hypothetical protein GCM10010174_78260 [Kutzneria viridogrisea]
MTSAGTKPPLGAAVTGEVDTKVAPAAEAALSAAAPKKRRRDRDDGLMPP